MVITWVTRSFLDYRIPVYEEVNRLCGNQLTVIYYADAVPQRCQNKLKSLLGVRAVGLTGEIRFSGKKIQPLTKIKGNSVRIPFQPGLINKIRKNNQDLIISDGFFQWTYAALWLRLWCKTPHLMCFEGTKHSERNTGRIRTIYRKMSSRLIDRIACNGVLSAEYLISLGYPNCNISLGNMAADTVTLNKKVFSLSNSQKNEFKKQAGINGFTFLFVGRLVPLKGVDKLIDAWLDKFINMPDASLLIVGDGPDKDMLRKKCIISNCKNICFTGEIDYDLIYRYFSIADVFIIPTLQDNWSLVVPEAMSCGLPIICSKYNGCWPELVRYENGWVFDPLDKKDFLNTFQVAWVNRNKWKQMGQESLRIVQDYSPEKIANNIFNTCKSMLSK